MPEFHHRRLPHHHSNGEWLFVTCHLHGSLPQAKYPPPDKLNSGAAFVWMDRYLDTTQVGPMYLRQEAVAAVVAAAVHRGVLLGHYILGAWTIMSNHMHLLLLPKVTTPGRLLQALKGSSAREANRILHRTGERFWQAESYDHWVRDESEYGRIARYIVENPVKAGLVGHAADYRWSSAWRGLKSVEMSLDAGRGRDGPCGTPPAQTRAGAASAHGSCLGWLDVWRQSAR